MRLIQAMQRSRRWILTASCCTALSVVPLVAGAAGIQSQLDKVFDGMMSNTTMPGVWESQRRGVIAGGRVTAKTRIMNESLVQFTPPSWQAGCGGVDLFGGSFSFINSDQIVELFRTIAANAKGYAFQIALETVAPDIAQQLQTFQDKMQKLNQMMSSSCQMAQGTINDTLNAAGLSQNLKGMTQATALGGVDDFFSSFSESSGKTWQDSAKTGSSEAQQEYADSIGNLMWKQMRKNGAHTWFQYGDTALLESIMSITGTVIIRDVEDDSNPVVTLQGGQIRMVDLLEGGSVTLYDCGSDTTDCMMTSGITKTANLDGLKSQILDVLLGTSSSVGLIEKFSSNMGPISSREKQLITTLPGSVGSLIRNLSVLSPDTARIFATEKAGAIALAMVSSMTEDMLKAGRLALANSDNPYRNELQDVLYESQQSIRHEYTTLVNEYGSLTEVVRDYNEWIQNTRKQRYMLTQSQQNSNQ